MNTDETQLLLNIAVLIFATGAWLMIVNLKRRVERLEKLINSKEEYDD